MAKKAKTIFSIAGVVLLIALGRFSWNASLANASNFSYREYKFDSSQITSLKTFSLTESEIRITKVDPEQLESPIFYAVNSKSFKRSSDSCNVEINVYCVHSNSFSPEEFIKSVISSSSPVHIDFEEHYVIGAEVGFNYGDYSIAQKSGDDVTFLMFSVGNIIIEVYSQCPTNNFDILELSAEIAGKVESSPVYDLNGFNALKPIVTTNFTGGDFYIGDTFELAVNVQNVNVSAATMISDGRKGHLLNNDDFLKASVINAGTVLVMAGDNLEGEESGDSTIRIYVISDSLIVGSTSLHFSVQ